MRPSETRLLLQPLIWPLLLLLPAIAAFTAPSPAPTNFPSLEALQGVHPRLFVDAARVAELRRAIQTTHAAAWSKIKKQADNLVRRGPPKYREDDGQSGDEQLWQREVGNAMPVLGMAWLMTRETQYLAAARSWALASCGYKTWGLGRIDGMDLATGHQLLGLATVYDWCGADLGEPARTTIRETLVRRAGVMHAAAASGKAWWHQSYLQNHLWVNICGIAASGFALFDEVPDAAGWISLPLQKFERTMSVLGPDGASHEGVGYWEYGVEYMLKFMHLSRALLGVDLYQNDWWRRTALYPQYLALPRQAWTRSSSIVDIADCPRSHWYGPDYLLRALAHEYRDGHAQWLAAQVDEADATSPGAPWLNLVWFDPTVGATSPEDLPTLHHFADMGLVSARSGWSGAESMLVFKCGPFIGHRGIDEFSYDPGGGHVHPDANHFVLFGAGEWLLRDDGYRAKRTGQHNTLLVDGRGQLGEGKMWFDGKEALRSKARPRVLLAESKPAVDHVAGDATESYPRDLGLRRHVRHLLFLKPDVLIVCDDIALGQARPLELRFHPESREAGGDGAARFFQGRKARLRMELLTPDGAGVDVESVAAADRHGSDGKDEMLTARCRRQGKEWRNAVAFSWCATGEEPKKVVLRRAGDAWEFSAAGNAARLQW